MARVAWICGTGFDWWPVTLEWWPMALEWWPGFWNGGLVFGMVALMVIGVADVDCLVPMGFVWIDWCPVRYGGRWCGNGNVEQGLSC